MIAIITNEKFDETYDNFIDEKTPARKVISLHNGAIIHPIGIIQPISIIIQPRYIIISAKKEKIMVVIGARIENPPKVAVETASVELIANTDAIKARMKYLMIAPAFVFGFLSSDVNSPNAMMPNVARAESHSEISIMALGVAMQIITTAIASEVSESFVLDSKYKIEEMISIKPARTTETEKPVKAIYSITNIAIMATLFFLPTPQIDNAFPMPSDKIARCIPLKARIWDIPIRLKSSRS